ncbi:unnamed protein product [Pleuronectes platessa]|uniref:Uncharacterized protein n=1 Tax=Pleuronectes platessa TaxID=8262 RepID=A0A9N7YZH0_PLEPL|nr:unnamed protein product [Pleuronectes platessa]
MSLTGATVSPPSVSPPMSPVATVPSLSGNTRGVPLVNSRSVPPPHLPSHQLSSAQCLEPAPSSDTCALRELM